MSKVSIATKVTPSNIGGLVTFLTVARASANRMLDAALGMVSTWVDGQPLYTSSFGGADWHWQADFPAATATDNETTCRPTSWVAGGLNGAAVRSFSGNPVLLTQTSWKVDSTAADNEGSGLLADPVKTDTEITRRWGVGIKARIAQVTTITYAQTPTNQTDYLFELIPGGQLIFIGTPTVSKAGTILTAVQVQVRTAGAEAAWAITAVGLGATELDKVIVITASGTPANVGAYSIALKDEGVGKIRVAPFGTFSATTGLFTTITPQVGDTIEVRDMSATTLRLGKIEGHSGMGTTGQNPTFGVIFDSLFIDTIVGGTVTGALFSFGLGFYYTKCVGKLIRIGGMSSNMPTQHFWRGAGFALGGNVAIHSAGILSLSQIGSRASMAPRAGANLLLSADCYFQNANVATVPESLVDSSGAAFFDVTGANTTINVAQDSLWRQSGAVPDWGTANTGHGIVVSSTGNYCYATKPTVNGTLGAGREAQVGGTDKLYAAVPYIEGANNAALVLTA